MPMLPLLVALAFQDTSARARTPADTGKPRPMAPIVVTVTRTPLDAAASPLPATTLTEEILQRDPRVSLSAVVGELPGIRSLATGGQIGKPVIRGLTGARVLVLDGSHRLEDYSFSDEDGPSVDPRLAQRVEVIRGPASLLYGSDAIGGVINAIPEDVPSAPDGGRLLRWRAETSASSNNINVSPGGDIEWASGRYGARVEGVFRYAGNIQTPAGEIENTGFWALNGDAAFGVRGDHSRLTVRLARFGGEFKLHEATPPPAGSPDTGGPERLTGDTRVQVDGETWWHGLRLEARGQVQSHNIVEKSDEGCVPSPCTPGNEVSTFDLLLNTSTLDLLAHHALGPLDGTLGFSGELSSNATRGVVALVPGATTRAAGLFLVERVTLSDRLSLLAGVRGDVRRLDADSNTQLALGAQTRDAAAATGDLGFVYRLTSRLSFAANAGRAFRAPNLFELFSNGPRLGEARWEVGDPSLRPETGFNLDGSLRWRSDAVRAEAAAYRNAIADYIFVAPTSARRVSGSDTLRVYDYGQVDALLYGGELSVEVDATPRLTFGARGDYVIGSVAASGAPLPLMPPQRASLSVRFHSPAAEEGARRWYAGAEVQGVDRQTRLASWLIPAQGDSVYDIATGSYLLVGFMGGWEGQAGGRLWQVDVRVRNALNRAYRDYLNRYKEFALDAGRSIELRVATGI